MELLTNLYSFRFKLSTLVEINVIAFLLFCLYKLYSKRAIYIQYIPQPPFSLFQGHFEILNANFHRLYDQMLDICDKYGDKYGAVASCIPGSSPGIILCDPKNIEYVLQTKFDDYLRNFKNKKNSKSELFEIIGNGIFTSDGQEQRRQRKLYSHMFSGTVLRQHTFKVFEKLSKKVINKIEEFVINKKSFDIQNIFCRLTIEGICNIAFGQEFDFIGSDKTSKYVKAFDRLQTLCFSRYTDLFWKIKNVLNIGSEREIQNQKKIFYEFIFSMISNIRLNLKQTKNEKTKFNIISYAIERSKGTISDDELKDLVLSFLNAGRDTTACAMTQIIYELCKHSNIEQKCVEEINQYQESELDYSNVSNKLKYLEAVFMESLRLHPSVPMNLKTASKDDVLPSGLKIKAGQKMTQLPYIGGRSRKIQGDNVLDFIPERFIDLNGKERKYPESVFTQFNVGQRSCLGKKMAILESKYIIARLLQRFRFSLVKEKFPINYEVALVHQVKGGLQVRAARRDNS